MTSYPIASWFQTRDIAALLTMRVWEPDPRMSASALARKERAFARVPKDEAAEPENSRDRLIVRPA
jgi:hypothetical protein